MSKSPTHTHIHYAHPFIYGQERSIKKPRKRNGNGKRKKEIEKDTEKRTDWKSVRIFNELWIVCQRQQQQQQSHDSHYSGEWHFYCTNDTNTRHTAPFQLLLCHWNDIDPIRFMDRNHTVHTIHTCINKWNALLNVLDVNAKNNAPFLVGSPPANIDMWPLKFPAVYYRCVGSSSLSTHCDYLIVDWSMIWMALTVQYSVQKILHIK